MPGWGSSACLSTGIDVTNYVAIGIAATKEYSGSQTDAQMQRSKTRESFSDHKLP